MQKLQNEIGYFFKNDSLLKEAFSHPSLHGNHEFAGRDYERLEFLGDAVVNMIVTDMLYFKFKSLSEGDLAKMRSYLVSKDFMVQVANNINLAKYIIMGSSEEGAGGRQNPNNLENVLEALIGAIYVDGGLEPAFCMVKKYWSSFVTSDIAEFADPKTKLQEQLQDRKLDLPIYEVVSRDGPPHAPEFVVECLVEGFGKARGVGRSIKAAEKEAALKLVVKLGG